MEGIINCLKSEFTKKKLSLNCKEPGRFSRSEWCPEERCSLWYMVYRIALAAIFLVTIIGHIIHVHGEWKWIIFMTQQGITILCLHYILEAIIVVRRFIGERKESGIVRRNENQSERLTMSWLNKLSWIMHNMSFTIALWITVVYWGALHKYVLDMNMLKSNTAVAFNFFMHAVNTISCVVDMFISDRPWRIIHGYIPVFFGIWYLLFSVIYWAVGGTGFCRSDCPEGPPLCPIKCDTFIYPIIDYGNKPGQAIVVVLGGCLFIPIFHTIYYFMYQGRLAISRSIFPPLQKPQVHE